MRIEILTCGMYPLPCSLRQQLQDSRNECSYFKQQVVVLRNDLVEECDLREDALVEDSKHLHQQLSTVKRQLKLEREQRQNLELEVKSNCQIRSHWPGWKF